MGQIFHAVFTTFFGKITDNIGCFAIYTSSPVTSRVRLTSFHARLH